MMYTQHPSHRATGFTLIELMITVAIIGILASIALPSYRSYLVSTRRADVQREITEYAQALERYYSTNGKYNTSGTNCGVTAPSTNDFYTITGNCSANAFTITATPATGKSQAGDGNQTLTNTGATDGKWKK